MKIKFFAEFLGTAFLVMIVFGSGIMGERLSQGNEAIALLVNSIATGAGLFVLIQCLGTISGAHLNPVVSLVEAFWGRLEKRNFVPYIFAQFVGAIVGVFLTHLMFKLPIIQVSSHERIGFHLYISEIIATFGLLSVVALAGRKHVEFAPLSIAAYIVSAYWFTSSTSFVNPAVTVARTLSDTFCGMAPSGLAVFIGGQITGVALFLLMGHLTRKWPTS
jgi:glycerol uptake facilitator-like aquaporin